MQAFAFGLRDSTANSVDDSRSRYVPSSIYSGPGPAEESPMPAHQHFPQNGSKSHIVYDRHDSRYSPASTYKPRPHTSAMLNMSDPVTMHLLMETAISDSKHFEILSFEELESLKRERGFLKTKIEGAKRQLSLEQKMRDAAQSINKLYPSGGLNNDSRQVNGYGSRGSSSDMFGGADEEINTSNRKIEKLAQDLKTLEKRLEIVEHQILQHTAGILQMTHKGLKKNIRKNELPRSPESMTSRSHRSVSGAGLDDFDERSLYQVPDYVHDFSQSSPALNGTRDVKVSNDVASKLHNLSVRLHEMVLQQGLEENFGPPPNLPAKGHTSTQLEAEIGYVSQGLDAIASARSPGNHQAQQKQLDGINAAINEMLKRTNSVGKSPDLPVEKQRGSDMDSQLAFSASVLERLNSRVDALLEQKDILTRQIQQQRELNSKSDAQKDGHIRELTEEISTLKQSQELSDQELQQSTNQISLLMDQLDRVKQDQVLSEQQKESADNKELQNEREARKEIETQLTAKTTSHDKIQKEMQNMEAQIVQLQTELTMVKAELDGAYGTRAERAADVSMNPAIQKEMDDLNARNIQLQQELKDTIEDYEVMTKSSIEFEKERDRLEATIDSMRDRCETAETQLSEEKVKWLGMKSSGPTDNTSTMVLKNEFKKMIRESRAESLKVLKAEQEERRRLESIIRGMKRDTGLNTPSKSQVRSTPSPMPTTPA